MSHLRHKMGPLEMYRKKAWKVYTFKLSAQTYLLKFKPDNPGKPVDMILLAHITSVEPCNAKGRPYPFEVKFKGKNSGTWVLNAASNEERMEWMEVILPGSSRFLRQTSMRMTMQSPPDSSYSPPPSSQPSPPPSYQPTSPPSHQPAPPPTAQPSLPPTAQPSLPPTAQPSPLPPYPTNTNTSNGHLTLLHQSTFPPLSETEECGFNAYSKDPTASLPANLRIATGTKPVDEPEEYVMPIPSSSLHIPTKKRASYSHEPPKPPPRPMPRSDTAPPYTLLGPEEEVDEEEDMPEGSYIEVRKTKPYPERPGRSPRPIPRQDLSPIQDPKPDQKPKPKPSPRRRSKKPENVSDNFYMPMYPTKEEREAEDAMIDHEYVIPDETMGPKVNSSTPTKDGVRGLDSRKLSGVMEQMTQTFSHDQLDLFVKMLQQVNVGSQPAPRSPTHSEGASSEAPESSLKSNLQRVLSYAPELSDNILITDDDDTRYEPRPEWAKAIHHDQRPDMMDGEEDSLASLEHAALSIQRSQLTAFEKIGEGQFGVVSKALLCRGGGMEVAVAVKTTKKSLPEAQQVSFMKEMKIMANMMHPNIVKLFGLVTEGVPSPLIVLEYLHFGDLKTFLMNNKRPVQQLVKYMIDVAMGMHYISERGLVHRDLAARNVLVGEGELCKVSDFGLLRELPKDDNIYLSVTNIPCPIRWMPPEAITKRSFSSASDVWSFGILQWEMFYPGKLPYAQFSNIECATNLVEGYRMAVPRECPPVVAQIMKACWHKNPQKRPSFLLILTLLSTKVTFG